MYFNDNRKVMGWSSPDLQVSFFEERVRKLITMQGFTARQLAAIRLVRLYAVCLFLFDQTTHATDKLFL